MPNLPSPTRPAHWGAIRPAHPAMRLARWWLILGGAACIAVGVLFDLEFVREHISADGEVEPQHAAGLQFVRLVVVTFGVFQIVAATALPRLSPAISMFLSSRERAQWSIFLFPFLVLSLILLYKMAAGPDGPIYWILTREDGAVEWITALVFLLSAGAFAACVRAARRTAHTYYALYFLLLCFFCLFVGLEEISYGQRLFGFATPADLIGENTQGEANIHNITWFGNLFFYIGPLSLGVFGALGCALPWLRRAVGPRTMTLLSLTLPPWYLSSWYVPYALFALYDRFAWGRLPLTEWQDSEVLEALLAFGFLGFAFQARSGLRRLLECDRPDAWNAENYH